MIYTLEGSRIESGRNGAAFIRIPDGGCSCGQPFVTAHCAWTTSSATRAAQQRSDSSCSSTIGDECIDLWQFQTKSTSIPRYCIVLDENGCCTGMKGSIVIHFCNHQVKLCDVPSFDISLNSVGNIPVRLLRLSINISSFVEEAI